MTPGLADVLSVHTRPEPGGHRLWVGPVDSAGQLTFDALTPA
jgi:hypothetical protein